MQPILTKHFLFSLLLHLFILSFFIVSFEWSFSQPVLENSDKVMNAVIVNETELQKRVIKHAEIKPTIAPKTAQTIPPKVIPIIKDRTVKENKIAIPDKKTAKVKEELLKKQLLEDIKKQSVQQKKQKQQALQAEFEKEIKELHAESIQKELLNEQKRLANMRAEKAHGEVNKYKALILQSISQHWLIPPNVNKTLSAELLIRVAPGGAVLDVQLTKTSGDEALDRSARAAVFKASPLPVPKESEIFASFRQFVLRVTPKNVLTNESWLS